MCDFNAGAFLGEAKAKMAEAELPGLNEANAVRYLNAGNEDEKRLALAAISGNPKERARARALLEEVGADLRMAHEELVKAVQAEVSRSDGQISEGRSIGEELDAVKLLEEEDAPAVDHAENRAFIEDFINAYGLKDEAVYLESMEDAPREILESERAELESRGKSGEYIERFLFGDGGADGFRHGGKIYIVGNKAITPRRTLEILKHETGHRGAEHIRGTEAFKSFLHGLVEEAGGIDVVREGLGRAKGNAYEGLDDDGIAEEYMCILAEKVAGKNELTEAEKSSWAKVYDFFVEALSGIPKDRAKADAYVANMIRALWDRNFGAEEGGDSWYDAKYNDRQYRADYDPMYSLSQGNRFRKVKRELPVDEGAEPELLKMRGTYDECLQEAKKKFKKFPEYAIAADGAKIYIKTKQGGSEEERIKHIISDNRTGKISSSKFAWLPNIVETLKTRR